MEASPAGQQSHVAACAFGPKKRQTERKKHSILVKGTEENTETRVAFSQRLSLITC